MIGGAKLAMEQIQMRLGTMSDLGDIVVTLSPCMAMIKNINASVIEHTAYPLQWSRYKCVLEQCHLGAHS